MERKLINQLINEAKVFFSQMNFSIPPFGYWDVEDWNNYDDDYSEILDNNLGWDITDFGSNDFFNTGLLLFTLRNGNKETIDERPYAEKIMIVRENQKTPLHYHWDKTEDIINRGGGNLIIELYKATEDDQLSEDRFEVLSDGKKLKCNPGEKVILTPGESITLVPKVYHSFWGESGKGKVLVGEVSKVNDDNKDNRFFDDQPRFSPIIENDEVKTLLVSEYNSIRRVRDE